MLPDNVLYRFVDFLFCTLTSTRLDRFDLYVLTHDAVLCFVNNSLNKTQHRAWASTKESGTEVSVKLWCML